MGGNLLPSSYYLFSLLKQTLNGHRFKGDSEFDRAVTWWLITQGIYFCNRRSEKFVSCGMD